MGKKAKKKHTVSPFERNQEAVVVNVNKYSSLAHGNDSQEVKLIINVIVEISKCDSLNQQVRQLQVRRNDLKQIIVTDGIDNATQKLGITMLVHFYLEPHHLWLRKSIDWIGEYLGNQCTLPRGDLISCISCVSLSYLNEMNAVHSSQLQKHQSHITLSSQIEAVFSLNCMSLLDRECNWLDELKDEVNNNQNKNIKHDNLQDNSILLRFINALICIAEQCSFVIQPLKNDSENNDAEVPLSIRTTASEIIRYAECAGECMRIISATLKSRREGHVVKWQATDDVDHDSDNGSDGSDQEGAAEERLLWHVVSNRVIEIGLRILSSELVNKDVLTSTALAVISMQWLLRRSSFERFKDLEIDMTEENVYPLQFTALLLLLRLIPHANATTEKNHSIAATTNNIYSQLGINPNLLVSTSALPLLSRAALFRSLVSVYGTESLFSDPFHQVEDVSLTGSARIIVDHVLAEMSMCADKGTEFNMKQQKNGVFAGHAFDITMLICSHSLPLLRLYGLQTLETWLGRVDSDILFDPSLSVDVVFPLKITLTDDLRACLVDRFEQLSLMLCQAWSHPSKMVSHMVPIVYQKVVNALHVISKTLQSGHVHSLVDGVNHIQLHDFWNKFITHAVDLPVHHRGRYQALSALLPKIGGKLFLESHPTVIKSLIFSMRIRDVCSSVCDFFYNLLLSLLDKRYMESLSSQSKKKEMVLIDKDVSQLEDVSVDVTNTDCDHHGMSIEQLRNLYIDDVVNALCSQEQKLRVNSVDYLIPALLKIDPHEGCITLITHMRDSPSLQQFREQRLMGIISTVIQARLLGIPGQHIIDLDAQNSNGDASESSNHQKTLTLTSTEVLAACLSDDVDLRLAALTLLTVSQKTLHPMIPFELKIFKVALPHSMKTPSADHRHRIIRLIRSLATRLRETYRAESRDLKRLLDHVKKSNMTELNDVQQVIEKQAISAIKDIYNTMKYLHETILSNLYPGAPYEREVLSLELMLCIMEIMNASSPNQIPGDSVVHISAVHPELWKGYEGHNPLLGCFFNEDTVNILLNLTLSSWDRTRQIASNLLIKFPHPLPGYSTSASVTRLWRWGCKLTGSPRQRESDAGANLLRVVTIIYGFHLQWDVVLPLTDDNAPISDLTIASSGRFMYAMTSSDMIKTKLDVEACAVLIPSLLTSSTLANKVDENQMKMEKVRIFMLLIAHILSRRILTLRTLFGLLRNGGVMTGDQISSLPSMTNVPLCHGLLLALRYTLKDIQGYALLDSSLDLFHSSSHPFSELDLLVSLNWKHVISAIFAFGLDGLNAGLEVVAEAPSDRYFAPTPIAALSQAHLPLEATKTVQDIFPSCNIVNTNTDDTPPTAENSLYVRGGAAEVVITKGLKEAANGYMFLNTNSFMEAQFQGTRNNNGNDDDGEGINGGEESGGVHLQHAVVGAWLLVKESCALLAVLVEISQSPSDSAITLKDVLHASSSLNEKKEGTSTNATRLLDTSQVSIMGESMLDALSRLKHMGAIAEAHEALQSVCESLLKHGDANNSLVKFPGNWLDIVLQKLQSETQTFILRRSSGFAYSFLSLLRAEPGNCKSVMLPKAMTILLRLANFKESNGDNDINSCGDWKTSVHALNIMRLILLDAALGPELDVFIPKAAMIAVQGFISPLWGLRNSSMMVFSAIVQRVVDNEKNESGGVRAVTAIEFFQRFPTLYPFLLTELASIVGLTVELDSKGWPQSILYPKPGSLLPTLEDNPPSLFPLLLLLSKLRTPAVGAVRSSPQTTTHNTSASLYDIVSESHVDDVADSQLLEAKEMSEDANISAKIVYAGKSADISLFIPLIEQCTWQRLNYVRVMSSKALASMVPLQEIPKKLFSLVDSIIERIQPCFAEASARSSSIASGVLREFPSNPFHGYLLLIFELVHGLYKQAESSSSSMGENEVFFETLLKEVNSLVVPQFVKFQHIINRITSDHLLRNEELFQKRRKHAIYDYNDELDDRLSTALPFAPAIFLIWQRIINVIHHMKHIDFNITKILLVNISEIGVLDVYHESRQQYNRNGINNLNVLATLPFLPLLWKECFSNLTYFVLRDTSLEYDSIVINKDNNSGTIKVISDGCKDCIDGLTITSTTTIDKLYNNLNNHISEVREGILFGIHKFIHEFQCPNNIFLENLENTVTLHISGINLYHNVTRNNSFLLHEQLDLLQILLHRSIQEIEPPLLELVLQLLWRVARVSLFSAIDQSGVRNEFIDALPTLLSMACGQYSPQDSLLDFMGETIHEVEHIQKWENYNGKSRNNSEVKSMLISSPTKAAGIALQLVGWILRGYFGQPHTGYLAIFDIWDDPVPLGYDISNSVNCNASFIWMWLAICEHGGGSSSVISREAAVVSFHSSGVLIWAVRNSVKFVSKSSKETIYFDYQGYEGGGNFAVRAWALALRFMQDDDVDIRKCANICVTEALQILHMTKETTELYQKYVFVSSSNERINTYSDVAMSGISMVQSQCIESMHIPMALAMAWSAAQYHKNQTKDVAAAIEHYKISDAPIMRGDDNAVLSSMTPIACDASRSGVDVILVQWKMLCGNICSELKEYCNSANEKKSSGRQKIFEVEQTNLHEEKTILGKLLASALALCAQLLVEPPSSLTFGLISSSNIPSNYIVHELLSPANDILQLLRNESIHQSQLWIGGLTYSPESFNKLYCSLVGASCLFQQYHIGSKHATNLFQSVDMISSLDAKNKQLLSSIYSTSCELVSSYKNHQMMQQQSANNSKSVGSTSSVSVQPMLLSLLHDLLLQNSHLSAEEAYEYYLNTVTSSIGEISATCVLN